ncbi:MAG: adenylate/guanylate cyclase domain-containing protein, partial [Thermodesulfobacteriota bacterium]
MQNCPVCQFENPSDFSFCGSCGSRLGKPVQGHLSPYAEGGQRKYLTVLFTDLAGYTGLCEDLDPEEVREVMGSVFAEIDRVVAAYDGFVSKLLGDSALILFGFPQTHEDDPIRAVRAALEIHAGVEELNTALGRKPRVPLCMHTGLNTGLTLIGWVDTLKTRQEVAGNTVNVASRLCHQASPGEILLGSNTYRQVAGYFECRGPLEVRVKGKTDPVQAYRVVATRDEPLRQIRSAGLKAGLVGRQKEMDSLRRAVGCFLKGNKAVVEVCGGAGSGKTRLVEELKLELNLNEVQWCQGYAYAYRDSIPYFPIIDLFKRLWEIKEDDPKAAVQSKVESGFVDLLGDSSGLLPYVGSLFSIDYPELEGVGPESWREKFFQAVEALFTALIQRGPLIVCLEDLHWADQECLNLLHRLFTRFEKPVLFVCVYRDEGKLWPDQEEALDAKRFLVRAAELSRPETMAMLKSLLGTEHLPLELERFVEDRIEGNPFYLTEVVNALVESGLLARSEAGWRVVREMTEAEVPLTIQGLLSARIDRLDLVCRKILQEASVFGRSFLYQVLKKVTAYEDELDSSLSLLELMGLITKSGETNGLEFVFNHALAQEVVYNGLLRSERRLIHDKIAGVIEALFADRLHEFFETLA